MKNRHLIALTSSLFVLANALFALSLPMAPGLVVGAGCVGALWLIATLRDPSGEFLDAPLDLRQFALCLAGALVVLILGGEGHFVFSVDDWMIRDSVLADVSRQALPVLYNYEGQDYMLRAPLGMYLLPGLVGRLLGLHAAHLALLTQNSFMAASVLYVIASLYPGRRAAVVTLFVLFGGLDLLPALVLGYNLYQHGFGFTLPSVLPSWIQWTPWPMAFTYPNHVNQMFWVTNHILSGWWFAALALLVNRRRLSLDAPAALLAPMALWSPLTVIVAPIFLLALAARDFRAALLGWRNWAALASGALFIPVAAFLVSAADTMHSGWVASQDGFWMLYFFTLMIDIPQAIFLVWLWKLVEPADRVIVGVAMALLLLLPFYGFGPNNDLIMRGGITPLAILAVVFLGVATRLDWRTQRKEYLIAATLIVIALAGPALEVRRSLTTPRFAISDCTLMQASAHYAVRDVPTNYVAPVARMPAWLMAAGAGKPIPFVERVCWPDHPLQRVRENDMMSDQRKKIDATKPAARQGL